MSKSSKAPVAYRDITGVTDLAWGEEVEASALKMMLIFGIIQLISVFIAEWSHELTPLIGEPGSVAAHALISSLIISVIATPIAYIHGVRHRRRKGQKTTSEHRRHLGVIPVTIAVTLLVGLLVIGSFEIFTRSFVGVMLDRPSSATVLTLIAGGLAYIITRQLMLAHTAALLVNLAVTYLFATLFFATYFNDNPLWWQKSFSYLGMTESNSRYIFDLGLIFTGTLVVIWQAYFLPHFTLLRDDKLITQRTHEIIRWVLILSGVLLAFVGIFRFGISPFFNVVHDLSATGMGVLLAILMLGLQWLVPGYPRIFYYASIVIAVLIAISALLKVFGHFSLVGLELAGFALAGLWLILFFRNTELLVARTLQNHRR